MDRGGTRAGPCLTKCSRVQSIFLSSFLQKVKAEERSPTPGRRPWERDNHRSEVAASRVVEGAHWEKDHVCRPLPFSPQLLPLVPPFLLHLGIQDELRIVSKLTRSSGAVLARSPDRSPTKLPSPFEVLLVLRTISRRAGRRSVTTVSSSPHPTA